jgi:ABC-type dipeptide/oligopeptide/nickel transport system ATPase subunit
LAAQYDEEGQRQYEQFLVEAEESGNTTSDINADWIDYAAVGDAGQEKLFEYMNEALKAADLHDDIYELGLGGALDPKAAPELTESILEARRVLHGRLEDPAYADLVETFDREKYITNMSVAENLLFGTPIGADFDLDRLGLNPHVLAALDKVGLSKDFLATGARLAAIMVELFQDLPPGHPFFQQYGFISSDDLPEYQQISRRAESVGIEELDEAERTMLMSLPFKLIPARHRIGLIDKEMQVRLLEARRVFADTLPDDAKGSVAFFDRQEYNAAASIQDNILFGRLVYGRPQSHREIGKLIGEVVKEQGLRQTIMGVGLDAPVGIAGSRLSPAQRQKLALARCLMKNADILIINEATAGLDPASQRKIMNSVFEFVGDRGLVWVLNRADLALHFDRAIVMEGGKILEHGPPEELNQPGRPLHDLVAQ